MITIGYSTRNSNPEFQEYLKKSSGHPKIQIIEKVNNGEKNLSQVYNEIISESNFDIIVLCHDDIYFDTSNWAQKLVKQFEETEREKLLEFRQKGIAVTARLGEIEIQSKELEEIFANLRAEKEELISTYKELVKSQNEFGKELTQKYGVGSYDIDTNTFTSVQ